MLLALPARAQDGTLDRAFGTEGRVTTHFPEKSSDIPFNNIDHAHELVLQPDGRLVAGGSAYNLETGADFALARYNPDGSLDASFGIEGRVVTDFPGRAGGGVLAIIIQPDGKLVAAGSSDSNRSEYGSPFTDFALARYNPDGSLDTAFGTDGLVTTRFPENNYSRPTIAQALVMQPDGKLVAAGYTEGGGTGSDFALARYNPDGSLDASFGTDGLVTTNFVQADEPAGFNQPTTSSFDWAYGLVVQADGRLVAVGSTRYDSELDFALARYNPDGSLDASFGIGGLVMTNFTTNLAGNSADGANALVVQPDGKLVAAGSMENAHDERITAFDSDFALARYNADGSLDTSFGTGGLVTTNFSINFAGSTDYSARSNDRASALVVQPDGKLVAVGGEGFALARYSSDGGLDASFAYDGLATAGGFRVSGTTRGYVPGLGDTSANALVVQPDGKYVVAGYHRNWDTGGDFALVRYNNAQPPSRRR